MIFPTWHQLEKLFYHFLFLLELASVPFSFIRDFFFRLLEFPSGRHTQRKQNTLHFLSIHIDPRMVPLKELSLSESLNR